MDMITEYLFSLPMVVFTIPAILILVIWAFSLIGMLDPELLDSFTGGESEAEADNGFLAKLGLDGVPLTVALTFIDVFGLALTYLARKYLMPLLDGMLTATAMGLLIAAVALIIAIPIAALCIKPLKPYLETQEGERKDELMGTFCIVKTSTVTESFGQAEGENGMIFSIRAKQPNSIKQGDRVALLEYDSVADTYSVTTEEELYAMSSEPHHS